MKNWMWMCGLLMLAACGGQPEKPADTKKEISTTVNGNEEGKTLFYSKCASCHMVNKEMTGPALKGVESRWPDAQKLFAFIRNSDSLIQKDAYSRDLWIRYNQTAMPPHPDLDDTQIRQILDYVNSVSQ